MYPSLSSQLTKKKDVNKSDAILIARFILRQGLKTKFSVILIEKRQIHDTI